MMRRVRGRFLSLRNVVILTVLGSLGTLQGQTRFRPESEREEMGRTSAYEEWIEQEGIPIYRGQAIPNLSNVQLGRGSGWESKGPILCLTEWKACWTHPFLKFQWEERRTRKSISLRKTF